MSFWSCLIQYYGLPIHRVQDETKCVQVEDKNKKVKWNLVLITSADNLVLLIVRVELGLEPRQK